MRWLKRLLCRIGMHRLYITGETEITCAWCFRLWKGEYDPCYGDIVRGREIW